MKRLVPSKRKRSIEFIGSAWKWIAGSPDSHDFEILEQKINNVLQNNNRQLIINELLSQRITEITNITNAIIKVRKEGWNDETAIIIERKLNLIEKDLQNIEFSVQWAKANIVTSFLFSRTEIEYINEILNNYGIPIYSIDELLTFGTVKIVTNNNEILYILSIPITQNDYCETYLVKAVKYKNLIDKIDYNNILKCNNELFAIKNNCKKHYDLSICSNDKIQILDDNDCITSLFRNKVGNCTQINNEHIPAVEEIGPDMILLNKYTGTIRIDDENIHLNGTYLITYFNTTIEIDQKKYQAREISGSKPLPAALQPKSQRSNVEEIVTLELLKQLHLKNIKRLNLLELKNGLTIGIGAFVIITILSVTVWILLKRPRREIKINPKSPETPPIEAENEDLENLSPKHDDMRLTDKISPESRANKTPSIYNIHSL